MSATFQQRLKKVMAGGNLRVADLARWFERPHSTVTSWLGGCEPSGGALDVNDVHARMAKLEKLVAKKRQFPVPRLSPRNRIAYLDGIRQATL